MALRPIVDTLESVPEALRGEYEQVDGKYHLTVELADGVAWRPVTKLTNAVAQTRRERDEASRQRAELQTQRDALATERDTIKSQLEKVGKDNADNPAMKQAEQRIQALEQSITTERKAREQAEINMAESRFIDELRREAAPYVLETPGALDDFVERRVRAHFRRDEKGAYIPFEGETPIFSEKIPGQPMTAKEFIATRAIKDPAAAYQLRQSRGAGTVGSNGTSAVSGQFLLKRGADFATYQRVSEAAKKAGQPVQIVDA
jgi:hypothetical protein